MKKTLIFIFVTSFSIFLLSASSCNSDSVPDKDYTSHFFEDPVVCSEDYQLDLEHQSDWFSQWLVEYYFAKPYVDHLSVTMARNSDGNFVFMIEGNKDYRCCTKECRDQNGGTCEEWVGSYREYYSCGRGESGGPLYLGYDELPWRNNNEPVTIVKVLIKNGMPVLF